MSELDDAGRVRAAGGLVVRDAGRGPEVLLVHRPRYDDWTLPKGKAERGEDDAACAVREVEEETSLRCRVVGDAGTVEYTDRRERPKIVRYYLMEPVDRDAAAAVPEAVGEVPEIDDVRWVAADHAVVLLTYEHDRALVVAHTPAVSDRTA